MSDPLPTEIPNEVASTQPSQIKAIKEWVTFIVAVIAAVSGIIFWVQSTGRVEYDRIEKDIAVLKSDMKDIQRQNGEILRLIGQLEGKIEGLDR